jgi:hypothetical protein
VRDQRWIINPIDAFILHDLEALGLEPSSPAEASTLIRRLSYDLTGLPPGKDAVGEGEHAYETLVDGLLSSPHFGERMAQHWLDLVRYAESEGFFRDALRPNAYRYRDYVIRAFNDNLPYNRFIEQQLAGDELEPDNPQAIVATGLNRLYPDEYNTSDLDARRQEILADVTDNCGQVFLGLTIGCAQCHDHKFDDISQADYFRLQAFFQPMLARDDLPLATPAARHEYREKLAAWETATKSIREEMAAILAPIKTKLHEEALEKYTPEIQSLLAAPVDSLTPYQKQILIQPRDYVAFKLQEAVDKLSGDELQRYSRLKRELAAWEKNKPEPLPMAMAITDAGEQSPPTFRLAAGNVHRPLEQLQPGFPALFGDFVPNIETPAKAPQSTGRRTALVRWLTRPDHPLTARVIVNRLWQYHFGVGIVASPNDMGAMGDPPSHPQLLDWLAAELVESGWRLKHIHRLIVTSATYRQSSLVDAHEPRYARAMERDPSNRKLWRFRRQRLSGESIRDAMLVVSGQLNARMFGPSARPELPPFLSSQAWEPDERIEDRNRRSVYVLAKRNVRYPLLDAFDLADRHNSCPRRATTTTAPQALVLLNSAFTLEQARHWAGRLLQSMSMNDEPNLIRCAYLDAFLREPTREETSLARSFIATQTATRAARLAEASDLALPIPWDAQVRDTQRLARAAATVDFCHALLNSNEFVYVD